MRSLGIKPPKRLRTWGPAGPILSISTLFGCAGAGQGGDPAQAGHQARPPAALSGTGEIAALPMGAWIQSQGGLLVVGKAGRVRFELSAPIVPCALAVQEPYPSSPAERERLAARAGLPFSYFRDACGAQHAELRSGVELSDRELRQNYLEVAKCAATYFREKPAWPPQLIAEVDVCARALGPEWSVPRSDELEAISPDERAALASVVFDAEPGMGFESLELYARKADGTVGVVSLGSGRAAPALRCLRKGPRRTQAEPALPEPARRCAEAQKALALTVAPPPPAQEPAPMQPWLVRFSELAGRLASASEALDQRALERAIETVQKQAALLSSRVATATRARLESSERYERAVSAVEEEGVSEAEHRRRVSELKALRKKLEAGDGGPALSASDARDYGALRAAVLAIDARLDAELEARRQELACTGRECAGKVRSKSVVKRELSSIERLKAELGKLLEQDPSTLPNTPQKPEGP